VDQLACALLYFTFPNRSGCHDERWTRLAIHILGSDRLSHLVHVGYHSTVEDRARLRVWQDLTGRAFVEPVARGERSYKVESNQVRPQLVTTPVARPAS
jgi:hypothetical protein